MYGVVIIFLYFVFMVDISGSYIIYDIIVEFRYGFIILFIVVC